MPDTIPSSSPSSGFPEMPIRRVETPQTDYGKIIKSSPLTVTQRQEGTPEQSHYGQGNKNQERREDRIKRENLLRYYDSEYNTGKRELDVVNHDLKDLENKIRNEEKEVDILEKEEFELKKKLLLTTKHLRRYRFELRVHKGEQMEKRIVQRRWNDVVKEAEAKLKKIKYGDWKAIRK